MDTTTNGNIDGRINIRKRHLFSPLARRAAAFSRRLSFLMAVTFTLSSIASPHPQFTPSTSSLFTPRKSQAANLPDRFERANQVDIIERNNLAGGERDKNGNLLFSYSQWIMWRWDSSRCEHVVVWWVMSDATKQALPTKRSDDGVYHIRLGRKTFESRSFRETWTTYDPELVNREVLDKDYRPRIRGAMVHPDDFAASGWAVLKVHEDRVKLSEDVRHGRDAFTVEKREKKEGEFAWWFDAQERIKAKDLADEISGRIGGMPADAKASQERGFDGPLIIEITEGVLKPVRVER